MKKRLIIMLFTLAATLTTLQASAAMYIVGNEPFGGWLTNNGAQMTDNGDGTYSYTAKIGGNTWFVFADGLTSGESDWDTFNSTYRFGPTSNSDETVTADTWTAVHKPNYNGAFKFTGNGSNYTITFDKTNMRFMVSGGNPYGFLKDGIYYNITSLNTPQVEVTKGSTYGDDYSGDVIIPSSVTYEGVTYEVTAIGSNAFLSCHDLTSVSIPTSVSVIREGAFYYCTSLTEVEIPESVTMIEKWNFYMSDALTKVTLPSTLYYLGSHCFSTCSNLSEVVCKATTPPSLETGCFSNMPSGVVLYVPESTVSDYQANTDWSSRFSTIEAIRDYDFIYSNLKFVITGSNTAKVVGHVVASPSGGYSIPATVSVNGVTYTITEVGAEAFFFCTGITSMDIGTSVKVIGQYAFYGCSGIRSLNLRNVQTIDDCAFGDCHSLTTVTIPSSVTSIGHYGFGGCGLTSITIPATVEYLGDRVLNNCPSLTAINVASNNPNYTSVDGVMFSKDMTALLAYPVGKNATSYSVPEGVTRIKTGALEYNHILQSVTLPSSLTYIDFIAFAYSPSLTSVTCLAQTPPLVDEYAFSSTIENDGLTLRVPYGSHEIYRNHVRWGQFAKIVSMQDIVPYQVGDVNGDGSVNITDATVLINALLNENFTGINISAADVSGDGLVNITDATLLINTLLNGDGSSQATVGNAVSNYLINGVPFTMVKVDGGTFMMGSEGVSLATPVHQVTLSDYSIGETEVTQALWQVVMGSNPSYFKSDVNLPVENMKWDACQQFVAKLSQLTGRNFRLPTEAEWEFAARGGNKSEGYIYPGSNNLNEVAWYQSNSGDKTHVVGTKKANELGLYDMSGNVFEWIQDYYGSYTSEAQVNPQGPATGEYRVCRSAGYNRANSGNASGWLKCAGRTYDSPSSNANDTGLRLVSD